jgi:hypothetical protein
MARPIDPKTRSYRYFAELVAYLGRLTTSMEVDDCGDAELARATVQAASGLRELAVKHLERIRKNNPDIAKSLKKFYNERPIPKGKK